MAAVFLITQIATIIYLSVHINKLYMHIAKIAIALETYREFINDQTKFDQEVVRYLGGKEDKKSLDPGESGGSETGTKKNV